MYATDLIERSSVTEAPLITPISGDDIKAQVRRPASFTTDDALFDMYASAAVEQAQNYTGRKFIDQEITTYLDCFPVSGYNNVYWTGVRQGTESMFRKDGSDYIELPFPPTLSITQVSTFDDANNETVYPATNYYLDNYDPDMYSRLVFNINAPTPSSLRNRNAVKIVFRVGYGVNKEDVPADMRIGMTMIGAYLYANRGDCNDCSCIAASGAKSFIDSNVIHKVR